MFMCIICMMKAPSLSCLRGEHRQLLESIVGPIIDMTVIKGCELHNCEDCKELMQSVLDFRMAALNGVREFKYVLSKLDKAPVAQAAGLKLRTLLTLDPITITEKPGDEIQTKKEFESDPEIVQSDEITIDIELELVKTEQDPLTVPDCVDSKNSQGIQIPFMGSTGSTASIGSTGFSPAMKINTGAVSIDSENNKNLVMIGPTGSTVKTKNMGVISMNSEKNKTILMAESIESTRLTAGIQTMNTGANSMGIGKKSPFMIGSTESTGLARFSIGMKTMNNSAFSMKSDNNKTPLINGSIESTEYSARMKNNTSTDSLHFEKNQTPHMVGSTGFNRSTRFSSGMKTINKKNKNILRKPSASNNMCQIYINEPKSTRINNKIGADSMITTKITPCGLKVTSVRWAETVLDLKAISTKQTTKNTQKNKTDQAGNEAEITSKECEIVSIYKGKKTPNPITQEAKVASEETYLDSTQQIKETETLIIQHSDSEQTVLPNVRKKNVPKKKRRRKPSVVKEYPCPYCDRILKEPNYKPHIKRFHYKLKPSPCKECGKVFRNKMVLTEHMKTHELVKPKTIDDVKPELFCVECSIQFYTRSAFKNHMMTLKHTSKEKYTIECEICKLKCMNKNRLKQHFDIVHLKKRKHKCDKCDKAFSQAFSLRQHIAIDHEKQAKPRPHVCHLCGKSFMSRKNCREHLLAHEGIRPFQCPLCPATFTYSAALFNHNKLKHLKNKTKCKKVGEQAKVAQHLESIEVDKDNVGAGAEEMKVIGELEKEGEKAGEDDTGSIEMLDEWEDYASEEDSVLITF